MVLETTVQSDAVFFGTSSRRSHRRRGGPNRGAFEQPQHLGHHAGADDMGLGDVEEGGSRKHPFRPYHAIRVPKRDNLQGNTSVDAEQEVVSTVTTVMLRHIPNKYTQASLLHELNRMGFTGRYDFFYLPMDVHNRTNVGYAFINFLTPQDALRFSRTLTNYKFQQHSSQKIATVSPAHVQGLVKNLFHFSNRAVSQSRDIQYRPIVVRNGCYRDCCEVLAEMLGEAEQRQAPPTQHFQRQRQHQEQQHQQQHQQFPARSNLNPSAKVFVPRYGANDTEAPVGLSLEVRDATRDPCEQLSFEDAAEDCRFMTGYDSSAFASGSAEVEAQQTRMMLTPTQHAAGGVKIGNEPEQDKEFEDAVLNWLQDEDQKKGDPLDMSSTEDGSHGSASGHATPTPSRQTTAVVSPDSAQSSNRSVYFPLLPH